MIHKFIQEIFYSVARQYLKIKLITEADLTSELAQKLKRKLKKRYSVRLGSHIRLGKKLYFPDISVWYENNCIGIVEVKEKNPLTRKQFDSEVQKQKIYHAYFPQKRGKPFQAYVCLFVHQRPKSFDTERDAIFSYFVADQFSSGKRFDAWKSKFRILAKSKFNKGR